MLGHILNALRAPGMIKPFEYRNDDTGEVVSVRTSPRYTVLCVGKREFYFRRENGALDGGGMSSPTEHDLIRFRAERFR